MNATATTDTSIVKRELLFETDIAELDEAAAQGFEAGEQGADTNPYPYRSVLGAVWSAAHSLGVVACEV